MTILDFFRITKIKKENEQLKETVATLLNERQDRIDKDLTFEQLTIEEQEQIIEVNKQLITEMDQQLLILKKQKIGLENQIHALDFELDDKRKELLTIQSDVNIASFGLYHPRYDFATALIYKDKLQQIRQQQKDMIRLKTAVIFSEGWMVNGSLAEGKKMMTNNIKQIIRSFNNECEAAIFKVNFNNIETMERRINNSFIQLNSMNQSNQLSLSHHYLMLKLEELYLAYEYEQKKQAEKEALREQREKEKEEKRLEQEIMNKKKVIDKDLQHYTNMIKELEAKITTDASSREALSTEIDKLREQMETKEKEKETLDYRQAHASAGYVYIISNEGAFGKNVFKIGVTRRLDPLDRIHELGNASVPFKFDIHALIFSYEAFQLETELHTHFNAFRVNKVNNRKEFFNCDIDAIEEKLKDYQNLTIDFVKYPEAAEFKQSQLL